jgi:uncharacterized protein YdiU (UPF0061 family)
MPGDESGDREPRYVEGAVWCRCNPIPVLNPVVTYSAPDLLVAYGIPFHYLAGLTAGAVLPPSCVPAAFAYCGVQFGSFAGQLGDGAAVSLGELVVERIFGGRHLVELQLKGVGPTPFTRSGLSGRKRLEPLMKEAVMMETLASLGVATSQALAVVVGDEGHTSMLRSGTSFLRFGTFELANLPAPNGKAGPSCGDYTLLRQIADYAIARLYPNVRVIAEDEEAVYRELALAVTRQTARLVASWMCLGWVHGALNTDNLAISGETLDHGSGAFMGSFRADWTGNIETDRRGLYVYDQQPHVCRAHCIWLAEFLQPLHCEAMGDVRPLIETMFDSEYQSAYLTGMRQKLGWVTPSGNELPTLEDDHCQLDSNLIAELLDALANDGADFTATFALLAAGDWELLPAAVARWAMRLDAGHRLLGQGWSPTWVPTQDDIDKAVAAAADGNTHPLAALRSRIQGSARQPQPQV